MNNQSNNQHSQTMPIKQFLKDYLWFILLLAPLAVIPFLVIDKNTPEKKRAVKVVSKKTVFTQSIEVTSAQVAAIVAKPISELLEMDVYFPSPNLAGKAGFHGSTNQYANLPQLLISHHDTQLILNAGNATVVTRYTEEHS